jgi:voltage-gated potassium channel
VAHHPLRARLRIFLTGGTSHNKATRKHLALFVAMVATITLQPLFARASGAVAEGLNAAMTLVYLYVFFVVFDERRERQTAYLLFLPVVASSFAFYLLPPGGQAWAAVALHCSAVVFLGYAVVAVLRGLFRSTVISVDEVFGAVCGYLIGGLAWGHLYALAYTVAPDSFAVSPEVAMQLGNLHLQTAIFNYLSFTTLTTLGYDYISPVDSPLFSLMWLEVVFGQFYMAVIVAQLVGQRLAQGLGPHDRSGR